MLTILGWIVSNYQANKREKRKELRVLIKKTENTLEEICKDFDDFIKSDFDSKSEEKLKINTFKISSGFQRLEIDLTPIASYISCNICIPQINKSKGKFYDYATGDKLSINSLNKNNFEKIEYCMTCKILSLEVLKSLENAFVKAF